MAPWPGFILPTSTSCPAAKPPRRTSMWRNGEGTAASTTRHRSRPTWFRLPEVDGVGALPRPGAASAWDQQPNGSHHAPQGRDPAADAARTSRYHLLRVRSRAAVAAARSHISQLYVAHCHSLPASQSACVARLAEGDTGGRRGSVMCVC